MKTLTIDVETTGLDVFKCDILCVGFKIDDLPAECLMWSDFIASEKRYLFDDKMILKVGHNIGFDIKFLQMAGVEVSGKLYDTRLLMHYINPHESHKLKDLAIKDLGKKEVIRLGDILGSGRHKKAMHQVDNRLLTDYCKQDVEITYELYTKYSGISRECGV